MFIRIADRWTLWLHWLIYPPPPFAQVSGMAMQLGEINYKEIIMNVDVETRDNLMEYVQL